MQTISPQDHQASKFPAEASDTDGQSHESSAAGPSRLSATTEPPVTESTLRLPNAIAECLLDVIWAVDTEMELRREAAEAAGVSGIDLQERAEQKGKGKGKDQPGEEFKVARTRLAELVRELLVSVEFGVPLPAPLGAGQLIATCLSSTEFRPLQPSRCQ